MKKRLILIIVLVLAQPSILRAECVNISGIWSTHATNEVAYYRETISQENCRSITIDISMLGSAKIDKSYTILMNNNWECHKGEGELLECYKGTWVKNNILLTFSKYEQGCLLIDETKLDDDSALSTYTIYSCLDNTSNIGAHRVFKVEK